MSIPNTPFKDEFEDYEVRCDHCWGWFFATHLVMVPLDDGLTTQLLCQQCHDGLAQWTERRAL